MKKFIFSGVFAFLGILTVQAYQQSQAELDYQRLNPEQKVSALHNYAVNSAYNQALPNSSVNAWSFVRGLLPRYLHVTFQRESDFMPQGRPKFIHPYGSTAVVRYVPEANIGQTGLLASGGLGVIRLSLASPSGSFAPGFGLKFPIAGQPSVNVIAMPSLSGQDVANPFVLAYQTTIPEPQGGALKAAQLAFRFALHTMRNAPKSELALPLHEVVSTHQNGAKVQNPVLYQRLVFYPTKQAKAVYDQIQGASVQDLRAVLARLPLRTRLFHVAVWSPEMAKPQVIGGLFSESAFVASSFGDQKLFFKHAKPVFR